MLAGIFQLLTLLSSLTVGSTNDPISFIHGPVSRRIVRGFEVDIKLFPHAVFLYFNIKRPSTCGSSLITVQAVITSAHCVRELSFYKGFIHAYLGASIPLYSKVVRNVTAYRIHPKYDATNGKFDLSVAKFNREVPMMHGIHKIPICSKSVKINDLMFTAGWGKKWPSVIPDFSDARSLVASKQRLASLVECNNTSGVRITPAFLCSFPVNGFHYRGDLGNGLVTLKPTLALVGVVSFMIKDATLYANLMNQRTWLQQSVKELYGSKPIDADCC